MSTTTKEETALLNATTQGIGSLVWFTLRGTAITPDDMRRIMQEEGDDATLIPDLKPAEQIRRAARGWTKGKGKADRFRASFPKGTENDEKIVTISILKRGGGKGEFLHEDTLIFDVAANMWTTSGTTDEAGEFRARADKFRTHLDSSWLRPSLLIKRLKAMSTITVKEDGGLYYVPGHTSDNDLDRLKRIIRRIGTSRLSSLRITAGDQDAIADVAEATKSTLAGGLSEITEKLARWVAGTRKVSEARAMETLAQLATLKGQADLYRDALGLALTDLDAALTDAQTTAQTILTDAKEEITGIVQKLLAGKLAKAIADNALTLTEKEAEGYGIAADSYAFWNVGRGDGYATADSLGYRSRLSKAGGEFVLTLTRNEAAPATEPKPATEPAHPTRGDWEDAAEPDVPVGHEAWLDEAPAPVAERRDPLVVDAPVSNVVELRPEPEPEPAPVETSANPMRAKLDAMTDERIAGMFRAVTGAAPASGQDRGEIIGRILEAVA